MRSFSTDRFGLRSHEKLFVSNRVSNMSIHIFGESMKMVMHGSVMGPHGLILDEDGATGCPMPLEPFPTPFRLVLGPFKAISRSTGFEPNFPENLLYIPFLRGPPV